MRRLFVGLLAAVAAAAACSSSTVIVLPSGVDGGVDGDVDSAAPVDSGPPDAACAKSCGSNCCSGSETCLGAQCCPTANVCGTSCCSAGTTCFDDGAGNKKCATVCTASSQCKDASAGCCGPIDTSGKCSNSGTTWACIPTTGTCAGQRICRCTVGADCGSGSCAPHVDAVSQQPIGPYVCKPNDGALYDGCNGVSTTCAGNTCCVTDGNANRFCANPCTNVSQCGGAKCNSYSFAGSSCGGPTACGP